MGVNIQSAIEEMTRVQNENQQLKLQVEQKDKLLEEMQAEVDEAKRVVKDLQPYIHIIEEEPKQMYLLHLQDHLLWQQIRMKAVQVFGPGGDTGTKFRHFIEAVLWEATGTQWPFIRKRRFDRKAE